MSWGGPAFIIAIIALSIGGWLINNWIRAKHGYALEDEWGGKTDRNDPEANRKIELLSSENGDLKDKMLRLEERISVLERIATDKGARLSDEIDSLRD